MKELVVGFLGCGNVGGGVLKLLKAFAPQIAHRDGLTFRVKAMLVRDTQKNRQDHIPAACLTVSPADVLDDPEIDLVVECLGGVEPATGYMLRALENGKTVITANKMALATNWHLLQAAADRHDVGLYYEASVGGAIPILRVLTDSLQANNINTIMGIINGTTNYILTQMAQKGSRYEDVLFEAQRLGLAEPDPTADVEGYDAAYKLSILCSLAFHAHVPVARIFREGITKVSEKDIALGKEMGLTLKLLAVAKREGQLVEVRVHPTFVKNSHPLASVNGAFNAVFLHGHACGDMMLYGRGAGDMPTASAVVSDMIKAGTTAVHRHPTFANEELPPADLNFDFDWESVYFIRLSAADQPGVLAAIAGCLGEWGVSIASMLQHADELGDGRVPMVLLTHKAHEQAVRRALGALDPKVATVDSLIRVEK